MIYSIANSIYMKMGEKDQQEERDKVRKRTRRTTRNIESEDKKREEGRGRKLTRIVIIRKRR